MAKTINVYSDIERTAPDGISRRRNLDTTTAQNSALPDRLQAIVDEAHQSSSIFSKYPQIGDKEQLEKLLAQLIIRFDTRPDYYTKKDYQLLISILCGTLQHLYGWDIISDNEDIIKVTHDESGAAVISPQVGTLTEANEDSNGNYTGTDNNEKRIATIGDIRTYINNKLTWIEA